MAEWESFMNEVNEYIIETLLKEGKCTQKDVTRIILSFIDKKKGLEHKENALNSQDFDLEILKAKAYDEGFKKGIYIGSKNNPDLKCKENAPNPENFDDGLTQVAPEGQFKAGKTIHKEIKDEIDKDYVKENNQVLTQSKGGVNKEKDT